MGGSSEECTTSGLISPNFQLKKETDQRVRGYSKAPSSSDLSLFPDKKFVKQRV